VNRRRALFEEAVAITARGCVVDITAFDVDPDEDAWSAPDALERYFASGAPPDRVTVSSDGGGCLPVFNDEGRVVRMGVGDSGALVKCFRELVRRGHPVERALRPMTSNVAALLRLPRKGRLLPGYDADLAVLDGKLDVRHVMARGAWHVYDGVPVRRGMFEPG
jgi:beta-aspartyl-dipeptidase (metallo-type)